MKRLIVDCGSTKADYIMIAPEGLPRQVKSCRGANAALASDEEMRAFFDSIPEIRQADELEFYGAGCLPGEVTQRVVDAARAAAPKLGRIEANSDMLGAARALLGNKPGIACILGTGSNSCLYDGERIVDNIPALGYILGDEGSGNHMGRTLLTCYFKRQLMPDFADEFKRCYPDLTIAEVIERVYRQPGANAWLASFAPFLAEHIDYLDAQRIVVGCLEAFSDYCVLPYGPEALDEPIGFVGSIAKAFEPQLRKLFNVGRVLQKPLDAFTDKQ